MLLPALLPIYWLLTHLLHARLWAVLDFDQFVRDFADVESIDDIWDILKLWVVDH